VGVHARAAEREGSMSQRTEVMLELVLDIKNNRRPKGAGAGAGGLEGLLSQGSQKWLKDSQVGEVQLRAVTWSKLLQPDKKVCASPAFCRVTLACCSQWHCESLCLLMLLPMHLLNFFRSASEFASHSLHLYCMASKWPEVHDIL